jgi:UDP-N-acetylmuramate dehydrogenase
MIVETNKKLVDFNFYRINTVAKYFVELKKKEDFFDVFTWIKKENIKKYCVLGEGANVIFVSKKYDGLVIKISNNFSRWDEKNKVEVGAGKNWDDFLIICQRKGFYDIQSMASIPGSTGAAVFGNIGAFGAEIKKYVAGAWVFDIKKSCFVFLDKKQLNFSYRNSFLKKNRDNFLVYSVLFDFSLKFQKEIKKEYPGDEYFSLSHFAKKHGLGRLKKVDIRKAVKKMRRDIFPDLKKYPNVGSTFKNTEVTKTQMKKILKAYPYIPHWELPNGKVKIPTAYILDKVLKLNGKQFGNIQIDKKRPLFFVNMGGVTGKEFFNLCQKIKKTVKKKLDVDIEEEVYFIK